jgi:hypothetical protein
VCSAYLLTSLQCNRSCSLWNLIAVRFKLNIFSTSSLAVLQVLKVFSASSLAVLQVFNRLSATIFVLLQDFNSFSVFCFSTQIFTAFCLVYTYIQSDVEPLHDYG